MSTASCWRPRPSKATIEGPWRYEQMSRLVRSGRSYGGPLLRLLGERLPADRALLPQLVAVVEELPLGLPAELGEVGEVGEVGAEAQHPASKMLCAAQAKKTREMQRRAQDGSRGEVEAVAPAPEPPSCVEL